MRRYVITVTLILAATGFQLENISMPGTVMQKVPAGNPDPFFNDNDFADQDLSGYDMR